MQSLFYKTMYSTLIIPDIHHRTDWINPFLKSQKFDELVFLGDFFDDFNDGPYISTKTALWVKDAFNRYPKAHFLFGNHDISYAFPLNKYLRCSGFTEQRSIAINKVLNKEDWNRFKLCHYTQGFLCSHAGISGDYFPAGIIPNLPDIDKLCSAALLMTSVYAYCEFLDAGRERGGSAKVGGITWLDWRVFVPLKGFNQIVGHTPGRMVRSLNIEGSENYCIDTHSHDVGIIEDGKFRSVTNVGKLWSVR